MINPDNNEADRIKILDALHEVFGTDKLRKMALVETLNTEKDSMQTTALQEMAAHRSGDFVKRMLELLDDGDILFASKKGITDNPAQQNLFLLPVHCAAIKYNHAAIHQMKAFLDRKGESGATVSRLLLESATRASGRDSVTALSYAYRDNVTEPMHIETILECVQHEASAFSLFFTPSDSAVGVGTITELNGIILRCKTVLERVLAVNHGMLLVFIKDLVSRDVIQEMIRFVEDSLHRFYPFLIETLKRSHRIESVLFAPQELAHKNSKITREQILRRIKDRTISESDAIDIITLTKDPEIAYILQSYFVNVSLFVSVPIDNPASMVLRQMVPRIKKEAQVITLFSNNENSCWFDSAVTCVAASVLLAEKRGFNPFAKARRQQRGLNESIINSVVSLEQYPLDFSPAPNKNEQAREDAVNGILQEEKKTGRPMLSSNVGIEYATRAFLANHYEVACVIGNPEDVFCDQHYQMSLSSPEMLIRRKKDTFSINRKEEDMHETLDLKVELVKMAAMSVYPRCASIVNFATCSGNRRSDNKREVLLYKNNQVTPPPLIPVELNRKYTTVDPASKVTRTGVQKYRISEIDETNVLRIVPLLANYIDGLAEYALSGIIIGNNVHFVCFFLVNTTWFFHDALSGPQARPVKHTGHPLSSVPEQYQGYSVNAVTYHRIA
jgi:hypothetical protein